MKFYWSLFLFFVFTSLHGQDFYRFRADFSIKEKEKGAEKGNLLMGTVYYDKHLDKLAYHLQFPEKEQWLIKDSTMCRMQGDSVLAQQTIAPVNEMSFFSLILNQELTDFGLSKVGYTPETVEQVDNQVHSTWLPPVQLRDFFGKIILVLEQKRLVAITFTTHAGEPAAKFYLSDYTVQQGLPLPGKIYQVYYRKTGEFIRLLSLKNALINDTNEENAYNFVIPEFVRN